MATTLIKNARVFNSWLHTFLDGWLLIDGGRVRYAFTSFCFVNLVNREGFPAMPFRSDAIDYATMLAFS